MASPLEGSIATTIHGAFKSIFYDATVDRTVVVGGDVYDPTSGTPTTTSYTCKGMVDEYTRFERQNSQIEANDRKILVLANSLSITPELDDTITIRSATYTILSVDIDPANAVWVIQGRR